MKASKEQLNTMLENIWTYTEGELRDLSTSELTEVINEIGCRVDEAITYLQDDLEICSHCEGDRISICNECIKEMAKDYSSGNVQALQNKK